MTNSNWISVAKTSDVDLNVQEALSVIMSGQAQFTIHRIPDVSYPSFFVLSASIILFYVTITDKLQLFVVIEKQRSRRPFITSTKFNSKSINFKLDKESLGSCIVKEKVAWDIISMNKEKVFEIVTSSDGLNCKIVQKNQAIGQMDWEPYWNESDTNIIDPNDLPPNASYNVKFDVNLDFQVKSLILVSTFAVHYAQKQLRPKKCTKKTTCIISIAVVGLIVTSILPVLYLVNFI